MIPLPLLALDSINAQPRTSQYVFTCRAVSKSKRVLDQVSGATDWQIHSLRHSCRTLLAKPALGVDSVVAERVLGHRLGTSIELLYLHHDFALDIGKALVALAAYVQELVTPPPAKLTVVKAA